MDEVPTTTEGEKEVHTHILSSRMVIRALSGICHPYFRQKDRVGHSEMKGMRKAYPTFAPEKGRSWDSNPGLGIHSPKG